MKLIAVLAVALVLAAAGGAATAPATFDFNGSATPPAPAGTTLHIIQADGVRNSAVLDTFGTGQQGVWLCRTARGAGAAPTAELGNDLMCSMQAWGYDGTSYGPRPAGSVAIRAADTFTPASHPSWFKVEVTPRGSTANIMPMFVTPEGHWGHAASEGSGGTPPTLTGCGTGASIRGDDNGGRVTIGAGTVTTCTVVFSAAWQKTSGGAAEIPGCVANNETSPQLLRAVATSTQVTLAGVLAAGDKATFDCRQLGN